MLGNCILHIPLWLAAFQYRKIILTASKFALFQLISAAEQADLGLTLLQTPQICFLIKSLTEGQTYT